MLLAVGLQFILRRHHSDGIPRAPPRLHDQLTILDHLGLKLVGAMDQMKRTRLAHLRNGLNVFLPHPPIAVIRTQNPAGQCRLRPHNPIRPIRTTRVSGLDRLERLERFLLIGHVHRKRLPQNPRGILRDIDLYHQGLEQNALAVFFDANPQDPIHRAHTDRQQRDRDRAKIGDPPRPAIRQHPCHALHEHGLHKNDQHR